MAAIKKITGNYKIISTDNNKHLLVDSPNLVTITVTATSAAIGSEILVTRWGQGGVTLISDSTCSVRSSDNEWTLNRVYSSGVLIKITANEWLFVGDKIK